MGLELKGDPPTLEFTEVGIQRILDCFASMFDANDLNRPLWVVDQSIYLRPAGYFGRLYGPIQWMTLRQLGSVNEIPTWCARVGCTEEDAKIVAYCADQPITKITTMEPLARVRARLVKIVTAVKG